MKKFLVLAAAFTLGLGMLPSTASASVSYQYVTDQSAYSVNAGGTVTVSVYLIEQLTGTSTSVINANMGLFSAGNGIQVTSNGGTSVTGTTITGVSANTSASPGGFGQAAGSTVNTNIGNNGQNAALIVTAGANLTSGGQNPGAFASTNTLTTGAGAGLTGNLVFVGTYTLTAGSTGGTDTFSLTSINNSSNAALGGGSATVTETGSQSLDKNKTGSSGWTGDNSVTNSFTITVNSVSTPEPSSMLLCGLAASGMGFGAWKRRKAKRAAEAATLESEVAV